MNDEKQKIRTRVRTRKKDFTAAQLQKLSENCWPELEMDQKFKAAKVVLAYWSLPDEVFTHHFIRKWAKFKTILLPFIEKENLLLKAFYPDLDLVLDQKYGIAQPNNKTEFSIHEIDVALVPGMAFDKMNNRLGRGKAYYDKLLAGSDVYKIGLCFSFQYFDQIPTDAFDVPMNKVIVAHEKFLNIGYLSAGSEAQKKVFHVLTTFKLMKKLARFQPILTGTYPLDIAIESSDLDINCCYQQKADYIDFVRAIFKDEPGFQLSEKFIDGHETVVARFLLDTFTVELFAQNRPSNQQNAYRHLQIEKMLLEQNHIELKRQIIELKKAGWKTEPAFAKLLNLHGEPFGAMLHLAAKNGF